MRRAICTELCGKPRICKISVSAVHTCRVLFRVVPCRSVPNDLSQGKMRKRDGRAMVGKWWDSDSEGSIGRSAAYIILGPEKAVTLDVAAISKFLARVPRKISRPQLPILVSQHDG